MQLCRGKDDRKSQVVLYKEYHVGVQIFPKQVLVFLAAILCLWTGQAKAWQTYVDDLWAFNIEPVAAWTNESRAQGEPSCGSPCNECNQTDGPYAFNDSGTAVLNARLFRKADGSAYSQRAGTLVTAVGVEVMGRYDTGDTGTIRVDALNSAISGYHWTNTTGVSSPDDQCRYQMGSDGNISGTWGWNGNPNLYLNGFQVEVRRQSSPANSRLRVRAIRIRITSVCDPAGNLSISPGGATICGGSQSFCVGVGSGTGPFSYQWRRNGQAIGGATGSCFNASQPGTYDCLVWNGCSAATPAVSPGAALSVNAAPQITTQPSGATRCVGQSWTFCIGATGTPAPTYQWRKFGVPILGATNSCYTLNNLDPGDAANYDCVVANSCQSLVSSVVTLVVNRYPAIVSSPTGATLCAPQPWTFCVTASGTSPLTYQWRKNSVNIAGATASCYTIASTTNIDSGSYDCIVTNSCGSTTSPAAQLTVNTLPGFVIHPTGGTACAGYPWDMCAATVGTPQATYQWRRNSVPIPGATSSCYHIASVTGADAGTYDCVATTPCGSVTSNPAVVVVPAAPIITMQPTDQAYCGGTSTVQFCVQASGSALGFQWYRRCGSSVTLLGAASSTSCSPVFVPAPGDESCEFYCEVFSGTCRPGAFSNIVRVTSGTLPTITQQPLGPLFSRANCAPFSVSVGATGSGPLSYQWFINGTPVDCAANPSACTNRITVPRLQLTPGSYQFRCRVSNACGIGSAVQSNILTIPVVCVADFDDGTSSGLPDGGVTIDDLLYYLDIFEEGILPADVDGGASDCQRDGGVTIDDLLYFLQRFEAGC